MNKNKDEVEFTYNENKEINVNTYDSDLSGQLSELAFIRIHKEILK